MSSKIKLDFDINQLNKKFRQMQKVITPEKSDNILQTVSNTAVASISTKFYKATDNYWHYFNKGMSKINLPPQTVAKAFYNIRTPEKEKDKQIKYKIAVYNNAETGYLGNVAVLLEYGFYNFKGINVWRKELRKAKKTIANKLEQEMKNANRVWQQ